MKSDTPPRRLLLAAALLAALVIPACAKNERISVYPTEGKALYRNKPAAGAHLVFHPTDTAGPKVPRPTAQVAADGSFQLSTYFSHDGAPAGSYRITVVWPSAERVVDMENTGPDILRGRYQDPKTTSLGVEVHQGPNDLGTLLLK
jgi:hypothetical protein